MTDHQATATLTKVLMAASLVLATIGSSGPADASGPASPTTATPERYRDAVFSDVKVTKGIVYTRQLDINLQWIDLKFDLYEPAGDTERERPFIIWSHGGWFAFGDRGNGDVDIALKWAQRGFVVASIDYRLDPGNGWASFKTLDQAMADQRFMSSVLAGMSDIGSGIDYFRKNASRYLLNPNAIFTAGFSAGAVGSLVQAYIPFNNNHPFKSQGVISLGGMALPDMVDPAEPPALMFHGTKDATVPISYAKSFCDGANARGGDCTLVAYSGAGHDLSSKNELTAETSSNWLFDKVLAGLGYTTEAYPLEGTTYHSLSPARILDTRTGTGSPSSKIGPGEVREIQIGGVAGVPAEGAQAVMVNVTVTGGTDDSHLSVWPSGQPLPDTSNINFAAGQTRANSVMSKVGADGKLAIRNHAGWVDVIADVSGWHGPDPAGERFRALVPSRVLDTRSGLGAPAAKVEAGGLVDLAVTGVGGVPSTGVDSVMLNLTVADPTAASHVTAWPADEGLPETSSVNFGSGDVMANLVVVKVGANGLVSLRNQDGSVNLVADVAGWYGHDPAGGAGYFPVDPQRILDTRAGTSGSVNAGAPLVMNPTGTAGVPQFGVRAVALNLTAINPSAWTHLTAWPAGQPQPVASNVNARAGQNAANLVVVPVGDDGTIAIANNSGTVDLAVDVAGWYG